MTRDRLLLAALIVGALTTYVGVLGARPLQAPDEFRYAEIPREMIATGDWTVPHLNGLVYFEKPVLGYWATAVSMLAFGENAFAARLPFALATLLTAMIVYGLVARFGPGRWPALLAAAIYLTSALVAGIGTCALLDALLALWINAAIAAFFDATHNPPGSRRRTWLAACGAACGAAFLTKGFLAFAVPVVVAAPYLLWSRRPREIFTVPWVPILAAALVAAPWCVAVGAADADFWRYFFWVEHIQRFAGGGAAQHAQPIWFYIPVLLGGALPWAPLLVAALGRWRQLHSSPLVRLAICWFIGPALLLSAASGKLPTYVLPCFAPFSILLSCGLAAMPARRLAAHLGGLATGFGIVAALTGVGVLIQSTIGVVDVERIFAVDETWKGYVAALACVVAAVVAWSGNRWSGAPFRAAAIGAATMVLLTVAPFVLPASNGHKTPESWIASHVADLPADSILVTDGSLVHAVCWCLRRDDAFIVEDFGELRYGLGRPDQRHRGLKPRQLEAMVRDPARTRPIVTLMRAGLFDGSRLTPSAEGTSRGLSFALYPAEMPVLERPRGEDASVR